MKGNNSKTTGELNINNINVRGKNGDIHNENGYFKYKYLSNQKKAEIFTQNSKIFIRSISDAIVAAHQITELQNYRNYDKLYTYILNNGIKNSEFLLVKYCNHDLCDASLIACRRKVSYEIYLMTKFSLNFYIKNHEKLKMLNTYYDYDQFLTQLLRHLKRDLFEYSKYIKNIYKDDLNTNIKHENKHNINNIISNTNNHQQVEIE